MHPLWHSVGHIADADDPALVGRGKQIYASYCAACHGHALQGQPLWRLADADSSRRAPALDQSGRAWLRPDEELFRIIDRGGTGGASATQRSMPAFGSYLADNEILAVLAFAKARWPIGLRVAQAALNPGRAGTPSDAAQPTWRFPAMCISRPARQRGRAGNF